MANFTFRYRFRLAPRSSILFDEPRMVLSPTADGQNMFIAAADDETPLKLARDLVLRCSGFESDEAANSAGLKMADCLTLTLVSHRIGVRPPDTISRARFYNSGFAMMKAEAGEKVVQDDFGLTVFPSDPTLRFASLEPTVSMGTDGEQFKSSFARFVAHEPKLSDQDRLAVDFFNLSFLQASTAIRLICLVTAIETLIDYQPRHEAATRLVNSFIQQTEMAMVLPLEEKSSLLGSLKYLLNESISRAGASLARERLGDEDFLGKLPDKFFAHCYTLRSRLVHGYQPPPSREELGQATAELELFVADLIAKPHRTAT